MSGHELAAYDSAAAALADERAGATVRWQNLRRVNCGCRPEPCRRHGDPCPCTCHDTITPTGRRLARPSLGRSSIPTAPSSED